MEMAAERTRFTGAGLVGLFEEAHQRARRRRVVALAVIALCAAGAGIYVGFGGGGDAPPPVLGEGRDRGAVHSIVLPESADVPKPFIRTITSEK